MTTNDNEVFHAAALLDDDLKRNDDPTKSTNKSSMV